MKSGEKYFGAFASFEGEAAFQILHQRDKEWLRELSTQLHFSFQELRFIAESAKDLEMWGEETIIGLWNLLEREISTIDPLQRKKTILKELRSLIIEKRKSPKSYPPQGTKKPSRNPLQLVEENTEKSIFGMCPVASERTVCCNLKTIDAVENCAYGCSYCTIQTFYGEKVAFDSKLKEKLAKIKLDPNRRYHIGTGQSSDSLVWGNKNGILDDLCEFADKNPNILLEFKTKSANASYFTKHSVPRNIVCSWSLNTETVVENEEHFTAPLKERIRAAEKVAASGTRVAFHFHPMVYYDSWREDYPQLAKEVMQRFRPEEVLFISFGSVTFIKPVLKQIRKRSEPTKILQMEMVKDPHGKLTYPDYIKVDMFSAMYEAFAPWREQVFQYLCMERAYFWDEVFGWHYPTNEEFEQAMLSNVFSKLPPKPEGNQFSLTL